MVLALYKITFSKEMIETFLSCILFFSILGDGKEWQGTSGVSPSSTAHYQREEVGSDVMGH